MEGRLRLREPKRGPKTKKGRRRYTGAWREPKVLIVYVVDTEGKRDARFAPVMDATLKGPDAVFALLRTYLHRLWITQADQVLFIADGAPWIWKRVPLLVQALGVFHVWRDKLSSIAYSEKLHSFTISATLQSTDRRHGIVGQKSSHFQLDARKR